MGEVYRATDFHLKRHVALKVLPAIFASDAEHLARFQREAEVLASLNHPNIAAVYGLENGNGAPVLVMEFVEGATLADRVAQGAIPCDEALPIARQIADALEAAHDRGIIHRDLKPANIKVRPDGVVKVLDFGLAKTIGLEAQRLGAGSAPTITSPAATRPGVILGTAAYMSPEQARGRTVDKRADIWAFGCVLFEMLTGSRPFRGEDTAETIGAVIHQAPDWSRLPASTPPIVRRLLERCLEKDARRRLRDIGEARIALEEPTGPNAPLSVAGNRTHAWKAWSLVGVVAVVSAAATATVIRSPASVPSVDRNPRRLAMPLAHGESVVLFRGLAVSPDAERVAFVSQIGRGLPRLLVRHFDGAPDVVFEGTSDATTPFFSPDNRWVAFFAGNALKKVPISGGVPQVVTALASGSGGAWREDGAVFFSARDGIRRVPADGGDAEPVTTVQRERGEIAHVWPRLIPSTDVLLYVRWTGPGWDEREVVARRLTTGEEKVLVRGAATVRYVDTGHLVYTREGRVSSVPIDVNALARTGPPVVLFDDLREGAANADYDVSPQGTLVYVQQSRGAYNRVPVLVDRAGTAQPIVGIPPGFYQNPRFSPDGRRVLMNRTDATIDLWLYDFDRQTFTVLRGGGSNQHPVWSSDGQSVVYRGTRHGFRNLYVRQIDGTAPESRLTTSEHVQAPWSWEGDTIAFEEASPLTGNDVWLLPLGTGEPRPVAKTAFTETKARLSPNGKTIAYVSDESGEPQIYAQPVDASRREQLSTDGGTDPVWARSGRELFYRNGRRVMVLAMTAEGRPLSRPRVLFEGDYVITAPALDFDIAPNGGRFVMLRTGEPEPPRPYIAVLLDWQTDLKRRAPVR